MRIECATHVGRVTLAAALLLATALPAGAQDALSRIGAKTQVSSIDFRFEGSQTLPVEDLRERIALTAKGSLAGLRSFLGFLPFVPPVGEHHFDPLELQRDVIRLRHYYQRSGFPHADVRYDVHYNAKSDQVKVTFVIREGPPLTVRTVRFIADSGEPPVPPELAREWSEFTRRAKDSTNRFGESERRALGDSTARWFRHAGFPFASAEPEAQVDSAANQADVAVRVQAGRRAKIRAIEVSGNRTVSPGWLTRPLPIGVGDWYDATALEEGRRALAQLDLVRLALLEVPRESADDSSVVVRLRVTENPPRVVRGEAGVNSGGGLSGQMQWTHRSFLSGLRTLTVAATAQTGVVALDNPPQQLYRLAVTLHQPYLIGRHFSVAGGPFVEYRDDLRDRSRAFGFEGTLVYAAGPLRSLSFGYSISHRRVLDYGFGASLQPAQYLPILRLADSASAGTLEPTQNRSAVSLEGSYGQLDQFANPRRGYVIRPRIEVTTPGGFNTVEYILLDLTGTAYLPLKRRVGLTMRAEGGRIYPFGRSLQGVGRELPLISLLRLRDVTFTAGGSRDVRGWGSQLLGPKLPEIQQEATDTGIRMFSDRYRPIGGLARLTGSVELQLPLPGVSEKWKGFVFTDGGRIWTPDSRFAVGGVLAEGGDFVASGVGVGYETVVGAVQVALGYKLKASPLDLRPPDAVLSALEAGRPIESVPEEGRRRFHLHFSIGATF